MKEGRKMKRNMEKSVSLLVAFLLFFEVFLGGFSPIFAKAAENNDVKSMRIDTSRENDVIEKGKDYTIFENEDGSRTMDMYTENVREKTKTANMWITTVLLKLYRKREAEVLQITNIKI